MKAANWRNTRNLTLLAVLAACAGDKAGPLDPSANFDVVIAAAPGGGSVNLDQWANGDGTTGGEWQNGNLNGNNSTYAEGDAVPFRLAVEGLTVGATNTITINYDFTAGGHKAYDFLASTNASEDVLGLICAPGGGGVSSHCGGSTTSMPGGVSTSTFGFPSDPFLDPESGKTVAGAMAFAGVARDLRIYGGTITSISAVSHDGLTTGNSTGGMVVTFTSNTSAVLLTWSGHLAQSVYWNAPDDPDGAGEVSGAPWHMRTLNLNGGGAANQDRSIQPSALAGSPGLEILKEADATLVDAGSQVGYTITVNNTGTANATGVVLSDVLPVGSGVSWSVADPDGWDSCAINLGTLTCNEAVLAPGGTLTVHLTSPTTYASCGLLTNSASVTANGVDAVEDATTITVQCPDLSVVKTPDGQTVNAGSPISFDVVVSNAGPGIAKGVTLSDALPAGTGIDWSVAAGYPTGQGGLVPPNCTVSGALGSEELDCASVDIGAGQGYTVRVTSGTTAASCTDYDNEATASASNHPDASDEGDITVACPSVTIVKTPDEQTKNAGEVIEFQMVVSNTGAGTATGVTLSDALPGGAGIDWSVSANYPTGQGGLVPPNCTVTGALGSEVLNCSSVDIPSGQGYTVRVRSNTSFASCAAYDNTAVISGTNFTGSEDDGQITVVCPDLEIDKTPDAQNIANGQPLSFSITVRNSSEAEGTASGVTLSDPLPKGDGVSNPDWSVGGPVVAVGGLATLPNCTVTGALGAETLNCTAVNLAPGEGYTVTVTAATSAGICGTFNNLATASATNHGDVTNPGSIEVDCVEGCTLTIGFWKNHTGLGNGNQLDEVSQHLPVYLGTEGGPKTVAVTTAEQAREILQGMGSNGISKLYAQLLATKLNIASGSPTSYTGLLTKIAEADAFLATRNAADWNSLSKNDQKKVNAWMSFFDTYNNTGPHCP